MRQRAGGESDPHYGGGNRDVQGGKTGQRSWGQPDPEAVPGGSGPSREGDNIGGSNLAGPSQPPSVPSILSRAAPQETLNSTKPVLPRTGEPLAAYPPLDSIEKCLGLVLNNCEVRSHPRVQFAMLIAVLANRGE